MRSMLILLTLLAAISGATCDKIVGGHNVSISQRPFQAVLLRNGEFFCGGVIISTKWIVTAAHCLEGATPDMISFRVGSTFYNYGGQVSPAAGFEIHPLNDRPTLNYDIAVVRLSVELVLSPDVQPIALPNDGDDWLENTDATVSGWGYLKQGGNAASPNLLAVSVPIVGKTHCQALWPKKIITEAMLCAGLPGRDMCNGDSGGPLTVYNPPVLVGIVSRNEVCGDDIPGLYAHVGYLRSFIRKFTDV